MPKPASPDRYTVDKIGTPDPPEAEYHVLELVHDFDARVALAYLGRCYERRGMEVRAKECFARLAATQEAFRLATEARMPKEKKRTSARRRN